MSTTELFAAACSGDRGALARLVSNLERGGPQSQELSRLSFKRAGSAYAVGITGAPGSGKSTLTSALLADIRQRLGTPVAVVAVDPSSPVTGGAILGDRVRMQDHALDDAVFIRSMATRGHLGGLAAAVPEAVRLLDATGWPIIIVETVGVGQVEIEVAATCDTVVVVVTPGWGDSVQANKAGLLETADVFVINKADRPGVTATARDLRLMLQLSTSLEWTPPIVETVALTGKGVAELWEAVASHRDYLERQGKLVPRRAARARDETVRIAQGRFQAALAATLDDASNAELLEALKSRRIDPAEAATRLIEAAVLELTNDPGRPPL
ncbi:MAG: methylmalonyl Co-A mutase-associated GTPase MeaB [Acidimicrobiales bacterium]|jgi:LAO/AO transport system kinase